MATFTGLSSACLSTCPANLILCAFTISHTETFHSGPYSSARRNCSCGQSVIFPVSSRYV